MLKEKLPGERYQRMGLEAEVIILKRGASWDVHGIDISATGVFVSKPERWPDVVDGDFGLEAEVVDDLAGFGREALDPGLFTSGVDDGWNHCVMLCV